MQFVKNSGVSGTSFFLEHYKLIATRFNDFSWTSHLSTSWIANNGQNRNKKISLTLTEVSPTFLHLEFNQGPDWKLSELTWNTDFAWVVLKPWHYCTLVNEIWSLILRTNRRSTVEIGEVGFSVCAITTCYDNVYGFPSLLPSFAPRFIFFFQLFFWSEGRVDRHRSSREETDTEVYRELQASVSLCRRTDTLHLYVVWLRDLKDHVSILYSPSFLPCLSPALHCHLGPPACSWECTGKCCGLSLGGGCCQAAEWGLWGDGAPRENFCGPCLLGEGWGACFSWGRPRIPHPLPLRRPKVSVAATNVSEFYQLQPAGGLALYQITTV